LLAASDLDSATRRLPTIRGNVPPAGLFPTGCVFRTRCPHATDLCTTTPPWTGTPTHGHACHHPAPTSTDTTDAAANATPSAPAALTPTAAPPTATQDKVPAATPPASTPEEKLREGTDE
jgi:oligopeptide/dipeptide ABC transporter ATP-binding protein